jgi:O-antigen/teichoic acid export membrane protein
MKNFRFKSEFARNIMTLVSGTAVAQAIPLAISPILTRLYSPEDFGVFALYMGIVSIGGVLATGRYEMSVMLPVKDSDAKSLVEITILISFIFCLLAVLLFLLVGEQIASAYGNSSIVSWLFLAPLSIFTYTIYSTFMYWLNRSKNYSTMSKNRIVQGASISVLQVAIGLGLKLSNGLIVADFFGRLVTILVLFKSSMPIFQFWTFNKKKLALARRYIQFPKFEMPASLMNTLAYEANYLVMPVIFGSAMSGLYFLVFRVLMAPAALIGNAVLEVFRNRATEDFRKTGSCEKIFIKIFFMLFQIGIIPTLVLMFYGEEMFLIVFGEAWGEAGKYSQVLAPMVLFRFVSAPLSYVFFIREKLKLDLILQFIYFLFVVISLSLGWYFAEPILLVSFLSFFGCLFYLMQIIISYRLSFSEEVNDT